MLLMGVTLYSCQSKYLELRIRKTKVGGWPSRILSGLPNGLLVWSWARTTTWPGILTNGADRARGREHSLTLIRPSISSAAALIGPLILLARLSLLLQSFLSTLVVTPYSLCEGCVVFSFFSKQIRSYRLSEPCQHTSVCRVKKVSGGKGPSSWAAWGIVLGLAH